jgi:hypothetical protein
VPATAAARPHAAAATSATAVINCAGHAVTRPSQYVLACADGNFRLTHLHWAVWQSGKAFANGTSSINDCVPSCAVGKFHNFPVLVALWRVEPLPHHPGMRYFTRVTLIYTGSRSFKAGGKVTRLPQTQTEPLSAAGGA